jgi:hypothetical protein
MFEYAKQKKANDISAQTMFRQDQASTNRSTTSFLSKLNSKKMDPNKSSSVAKKIASQILKKSKKIIQPSDLVANNTDSDQMRRKGSTSSSSSTDSKRKVTKRTNELFPEKPKPLMSSETSIFNRQAPIFKPAMMNPPQSVASTTTTTSGLFSSSTKSLTNPFDLISSSAKLPTNNEPNLFSRLMQKQQLTNHLLLLLLLLLIPPPWPLHICCLNQILPIFLYLKNQLKLLFLLLNQIKHNNQVYLKTN